MLQSTYLVEKEIDGVTYALLPLASDKVIEHGNALISAVLAPALGNASVTGMDSIERFAAQAMIAVLQNLSHPVVKALIKDVWETALVDNKPLGKDVWKIYFLGESGKMVRFLTWALEAQLSDFFGSLLGVLKDAGAALKLKAAEQRAKVVNLVPE